MIYSSVKSYYDHLVMIENKYLPGANNIVLGNNGSTSGNNNFIRANGATVHGSHNYVMDSKLASKPLSSDQSLRIGKYEIDLTKIEHIRHNPRAAIRIH